MLVWVHNAVQFISCNSLAAGVALASILFAYVLIEKAEPMPGAHGRHASQEKGKRAAARVRRHQEMLFRECSNCRKSSWGLDASTAVSEARHAPDLGATKQAPQSANFRLQFCPQAHLRSRGPFDRVALVRAVLAPRLILARRCSLYV